jgi:chromosome segregation ATPase
LNHIDQAGKTKSVVDETLKVKESLLKQVETRITNERETWEETLRARRENLEFELKKKRKDTEETLKRLQDEAAAAMSRLSKQLYMKHENAVSTLSERANQIELLHLQLSKVVEQNKFEKNSINNLRKEFEDCKNELKESNDEIVALAQKNLDKEKQYNKLHLLNNKTKETEQLLAVRLDNSNRVETQLNERSDEQKKRQVLIEEEEIRLSKLLKEMQSEKDDLIEKTKSLNKTESKLKEYAQLLKTQGIEMKLKEKEMKNAAKTLTNEKKKRLSHDKQQETAIKEEKEKNVKLHHRLQQIEEEINTKDEIILHLQESEQNLRVSKTQQKLHELALELNERDKVIRQKEEKMSQDFSDLETKRNECEARLAVWENNLKANATDLGFL